MSLTKIILVAMFIFGFAFCFTELSHKYFGFNKFLIEKITISGCIDSHLNQAQIIANEICLGKSLFWFDSNRLRSELEKKRWIKSVLIRRDPPDHLNLVVIERQALLWLAWPQGIFLIDDEGVVFDKLNDINIASVPTIADPKSQNNKSILKLIQTASNLRSKQKEFYDRVTELRWNEKCGPIAFFDNLEAPIYLSRKNAVKNIPNFQMLFLNKLSNRPDLNSIRYIDLRWDDKIAIGEPMETKG